LKKSEFVENLLDNRFSGRLILFNLCSRLLDLPLPKVAFHSGYALVELLSEGETDIGLYQVAFRGSPVLGRIRLRVGWLGLEGDSASAAASSHERRDSLY
jgi:hypothetical protein